MTTIYEKKARCAVCGTEGEYYGIGSTSAFGSPDLDTRPPYPQRGILFALVDFCPGCGYCASDITEAPPQAAKIVSSAWYQEQLFTDERPDEASEFLCKALIDEAGGDLAAASWALIHAAWACDDEKRTIPAMELRSRAADMILKTLDQGQHLTDEPGADTAVLADLLRRAGRGADAKRLISANRQTITEDIILQVLSFQETLVDAGDEACHTISEALEEEN